MSKEVLNVSIDVLKPHPRNNEFFDDIEGEEYEQFKKSIAEDGIISEILVAPDMTIISGHQRYRAAKDVGLENVPIRMQDDLDTEDKKLKALLAANFGRTKNDEAKQRKLIVEYAKLCGYGHGGDRKSSRQSGSLKLADMARELGMSERSLGRAIAIEKKLPEPVKKLLDDGRIPQAAALDIMRQLPEEDQINLISNLTSGKKYTQKQISEAIQEYKEKQSVDIQKKDEEIQKLKGDISVLKEQGDPEKDKKIKELEDKVAKQDKEIEDTKEQNHILAKSDIESSKLLSAAMGSSTNYQMVSHCTEITDQMKDFLSQMAKYDYMADSFLEIPDAMRFEYERCIKAIYTWADNILGVISNAAPVGEYVEVE